MFRKFTQRARNTVLHAQEEARELGHPAIGTEHILLGLLKEGEGVSARALINLSLELDKLREEIIKFIGKNDVRLEGISGDLPITPRAKKVFNMAFDEARQQGVNYVGTEHLLIAILNDEDCVASKVLVSMGVKITELKQQVVVLLGGDMSNNYESDLSNGGNKEIQNQVSGKRKTKSKTPNLDSFSRDLTLDAQEGRLDPVIGRDTEIERVIQILSRRSKNNPVLIGDPGVGKTAIIEGLAQRIKENKVPETLNNKRVVALDLSSMIAGTKYRGEFEDRLTKIISEIKNSGNVIVFIDEMHTLVGAGAAEGAIDAANILKPSLARGEMQCVGATTINEYRKYIEKDAALERRFQPIVVDEPSWEETIAILKGLRDRYEAHHSVKISDEAIEAAVKLSARYINDRFLPDKAIDLIDEASSKVSLANYVVPDDVKIKELELEDIITEKEASINQQEYEKAAHLRDEEKRIKDELEDLRNEWKKKRSFEGGRVTADDIAGIVSSWSGIPLNKMAVAESNRLLNLEETLHQRVVGQEEAVKAVSKAVRRARAGLKNPKRPIGSFIFLGPTGVGKTELARALAESLFGSEDAMIRMDMSEYMEKHAVARMVGAPPGYVGYEEGGQLTEKVRRRPYSVILLDEIEKAHPDVYNILLQVLEDGRMTDGQGRMVDFRNTIIIMTSNVGAENLQKNRAGLGFNRVFDGDEHYNKIKEQVMEQMKNTFKPEFLNRIDETIVFASLNENDLKTIVKILLKDLEQRLKDNGYEFEVSEAACDIILKQGYDPNYGARPLKRAIQKLVEDVVSEEILKKSIEVGDKVLVDAQDEKILIVRA